MTSQDCELKHVMHITESPYMYDEYRNCIRARIKMMDISAAVLVLLIITLVFGFLGTVVSFEYLQKPKPSAIAVFGDEVWRLRDTISETSKRIESLQSDKGMAASTKALGFQNNVAALNEGMKATGGRLDELAKSIYENQGKVIDSYLNEKRILFVISGLFVAYLVKLFSGLYKYNAYLKAHYVAVLDALDLSMIGASGSNQIDLARFNELLTSLSVKHLRIDQGGSLFEGLLPKKEKPDA